MTFELNKPNSYTDAMESTPGYRGDRRTLILDLGEFLVVLLQRLAQLLVLGLNVVHALHLQLELLAQV